VRRAVDEAPRLAVVLRLGEHAGIGGLTAVDLLLLAARGAAELIDGEEREGHRYEQAQNDRDPPEGALDHGA